MKDRLLKLMLVPLFLLLAFSPANAAINDWSNFGPYGGTINCIAVSPNFAADHTAFVGTSGRGVFKTTDGGATWTEVNSGGDGVTVWNEVNCIALQPGYNDTVGGLKTVLVGNRYEGILRSTDGGAAWTKVLDDTGGTEYNIRSISFAQDTPGTVYAGGHLGWGDPGHLFKSVNGGAAWTKDETWPGHSILSVLVSPRYDSDGVVYVWTEDDYLWRKTEGNAWASYSTGLVGNDVFCLAASAPVLGAYSLFAGTDDNVYFLNGSGTWDEKSSGLPDGSGPAMSIALSPNYNSDGTLIVGLNASGVFISTNSGDSWSAADSGATFTHMLSVAAGPGVYFSGSRHGGVRKSADGTAWSAASKGITACSPSAIGLSPSYGSDGTAFAGTIWEGIYKTTNSGTTWTEVNNGLVVNGLSTPTVNDIAVSPTFASTGVAIAATENGIFRTGDGGASWTKVKDGMPGYQIKFSPNFVSDQTVYAAAGIVALKSMDMGLNWAELNGANGLPADGAVAAIAISPDGGALFAANSSHGVYKSTDGGANWTQAGYVDGPLHLGVSPAFPSDGMAFAGTAQGVEKTEDGGDYWFETGPASACNGIAVSPRFATDGLVFSIFDDTIFYSENGGNNWWGYLIWPEPNRADVIKTTDTPAGVAVFVAPYCGTGGTGTFLDLTFQNTPTYELTLSVSPDGGGSIDGTGGSYSEGSEVTLEALPAAGYHFKHWTGIGADPVTTNPVTVTMNSDKDVTAVFERDNSLTLSYTQNGVMVTLDASLLVSGSLSGKTVKFYASTNGGATWALKSSVLTDGNGDCEKIIKFANGTYLVKAEYAPTGGAKVASDSLDLVVAPVQVPLQLTGTAAITTDRTPEVSWTEYPDATGYIIQTCLTAKFAAGTFTETEDSDGIPGEDLPDLYPAYKGKKVYYRVIAIIPAGFSAASKALYLIYKEQAALMNLDPVVSGLTIKPTVTLNGLDSLPGISGKTVSFYYRLTTSTGSWLSAGSGKTNVSGDATIALPKRLPVGTYDIKAVFKGDTWYKDDTVEGTPFTIAPLL